MKPIILACLAWLWAATPSFAASLEAYGRLPAMQQVQISPDGSKIAYIAELKGAERVIVHDRTTKKAVASAKKAVAKAKKAKAKKALAKAKKALAKQTKAQVKATKALGQATKVAKAAKGTVTGQQTGIVACAS